MIRKFSVLIGLIFSISFASFASSELKTKPFLKEQFSKANGIQPNGYGYEYFWGFGQGGCLYLYTREYMYVGSILVFEFIWPVNPFGYAGTTVQCPEDELDYFV